MKAIDLFSGFGGFTAGAEQAGVRVVWAANHWQTACDVHSQNHPTVEHVCQDLRQADWSTLPRYDILCAAPACQGHSSASQPNRRPYHDEMRATAWAVVDCADATEPRAIIVENVLKFRLWRLFPLWCAALRRIGFHIDQRIILATDHGVPQLRRRLFIVGTRKPRYRLQPTSAGLEPAFGPQIELDATGWRPIADAADGSRPRIAAAQARHGRRCLVQHTTGHSGVPLHEPIRTITTKDQWILVDGDQYRPLTMREYARGQGFNDAYRWPDGLSRADTLKGLGNAVPPPVARDVVMAVAEAA